jgi:hypothetical protein
MRKFNKENWHQANVGDLIPYYLQNNAGEPWSYNHITKWGDYEKIVSQAPNSDPFLLNISQTIPLLYGSA